MILLNKTILYVGVAQAEQASHYRRYVRKAAPPAPMEGIFTMICRLLIMLSSRDEVKTLTQKLTAKNIKYAVRHIDHDNGSLSDFIRIGLICIYRPEMLYRIYVEKRDMGNARRLL